jgi:hypothetical protein
LAKKKQEGISEKLELFHTFIWVVITCAIEF